jgi:hypothetical protein
MTMRGSTIRRAARGACVAAALLSAGWPLRAAGAAPAVVFEIDAAKTHAISPYVYGTNSANWQGNSKYLTLTRWGGNRITAYNWVTNASNAGSDWNHQNDNGLSPTDEPGEPVRRLVAAAHAAGASAIITVPILGYVAADKKGGGDVNQTPNYLKTRFLPSLPQKKGPLALRPDLRDGKVYQDEFVHWLEASFPESRKDPTRTIFYTLDNEPDLWSFTHARIHPEKVRYDEIVKLNIAYAQAIKRVAPRALVFGPVNYGWQGFVNLQDAPDAGGRDFLEFYLAAMQEAEQKAHRRLLDVLDLHWYPEARGGDVRISEDDARPAVAAARVQAPRSLWDPKYVETSWITGNLKGAAIRLLPRVQEKIDANYPGTRVAITEYYYGGGGDISGGLAQADVLGIFGREGVFAATLWHMGKTDDRFIYAAFAMFRNYDGRGAAFGATGLAAKTSDVASTSVYASLNAKKQLVLVAINKSSSPVPATIQLKDGRRATIASAYQLTAAGAQPVKAVPRAKTATGPLSYVLPAQSVSTLVLALPAARPAAEKKVKPEDADAE